MTHSAADRSLGYFRTFAMTRAGIVLDEDKDYLIDSRLTPVARRHGFGTLAELATALARTVYGPMHQDVLEALTTNETSFFRDGLPFELLRTRVLPDVIARRQHEKRLTIWCAAASTGQEPYSVAMLLREYFPELRDWHISFVATDLSTTVLARAREGRYSQLEVNRGVPVKMLVKYFDQHAMHWQLHDDVRRLVQFREMNLIDRWPDLGTFDIVFMRNVLIYFDVETKREILRKTRLLMHPQSYLFLGAAETTLMIDSDLRRMPGERGMAYQIAPTPSVGAHAYAR